MHVRSHSDIQDCDDDDYEKQNAVLMMTIRIWTNFAQVFVYNGMQGGDGGDDFRMIVYSQGRFLVRSPSIFSSLLVFLKYCQKQILTILIFL